ncbi:MAG: hypothetical protein Kow0091_15090 [Geminocystis sp.]
MVLLQLLNFDIKLSGEAKEKIKAIIIDKKFIKIHFKGFLSIALLMRDLIIC